jgi:hypothetical protein
MFSFVGHASRLVGSPCLTWFSVSPSRSLTTVCRYASALTDPRPPHTNWDISKESNISLFNESDADRPMRYWTLIWVSVWSYFSGVLIFQFPFCSFSDWWETPKERDHLEDQGVGGKMGSEWILDWLGRRGLDSTDSGQGPVAGCCECGDESSGSCATELVT